MRKEEAVAALGQRSLLLPGWVQAALAANDRLKLYLSLLQEAARHAGDPQAAVTDWSAEFARAGVTETGWLQELVRSAYLADGVLMLRHLDRWCEAVAADLQTMARPVCESAPSGPAELLARRDAWLEFLHSLDPQEGLEPEQLAALTHGERERGDSLHLLVMDLHKALNALAAEIATEELDGANVWGLAPEDRPLVRAFMRGLRRTAPLKFSHPGLDTAATRDGARLLIQNDIGTNDVHVLVVTVEDLEIRLNYSDLHRGRFRFFQRLLEEVGFVWTVQTSAAGAGLNAGRPYMVGEAVFRGQDRAALEEALEELAAKIVFVIDWNRARKRLQQFVGKAQAQEILYRAAKEECGHMGWLLAGGERLVFAAMESVDGEAFRIGDRLDEVLGPQAAGEYLFTLLRVSSRMLLERQPVDLVADEARILLARLLRQRTFELELLAEHAAYTHAIAREVCAVLEEEPGPEALEAQGQRGKQWEREADHLLMQARARAERHSRWQPLVALMEHADDVSDALEEALFLHSLLFVEPLAGLTPGAREPLSRLADTTLAAIQDLVRAVEIARAVSAQGEAEDEDAFLQTLWRILRAERLCDQLAREASRAIVATMSEKPTGAQIAGQMAAAVEKASDGLLAVGYALRQMVMARTGVTS
ncbi:MAG: phosphate transport regulator [Tepidiphilus sp.]